MDKLYDPNANDPYQDVALIFAGFQCDECSDYSSGNPNGSLNNPLGRHGSPELDCVTMASVARGMGWLVSRDSPDEFRVLCPACSHGQT